MNEVLFLKKGEATYEKRRNGKLYKMLMKSERMEAILSELKPNTESRVYKHIGEEIHIVLKGSVEYSVGAKRYEMEEGDVLWHPSDLPHQAKNKGNKKAMYLTVGSPPTFM